LLREKVTSDQEIDAMPRPPILPTVDWKSVFEKGRKFDAWLAAAENQDNAQKMRQDAEAFPRTLPPHIVEFLKALRRPIHVLAFAEDWCGDVVRHAPVLEALGRVAPQVKIRFFSRQDSPDTFIRFLTNGGEAIPKFVFLSDQFVEVGNWGPMPAECREMIARGKACGDGKAARERVSQLYQADPERHQVLDELIDLLGVAAADRP
jgi:hypothetical protein